MNTPPLSPKLTFTQIAFFLYDQHANYVDDQVMNHLSTSLEDMADLILKAEKDHKGAQVKAAYLESAKETACTGREIPGFGDLRGQLDALSVYRAAA